MKPLALALLALGLATCSLDPVHDEAVSDFGGEAPGVPPGPLHRPGQPCLTCHDGATAHPQMSVGGTIYGVLGERAPLANAIVTLTDVNGSTFTATTNAAGNFYVEPSSWSPTFPLHAAVRLGPLVATMSSLVGRDGSCAGCHADPPSRISAGPVYLAAAAALLPDAGAP